MAHSALGPVNIVVWEWKEDNGQWIPYDASTTQQIEHEYQNGSDMKLFITVILHHQQSVMYKLDLINNTQTNQLSRTKRAIKRSLYPDTSAFANGLRWEWCGRSGRGREHWIPYSVKASNEIEQQHQNGTSTFAFPTHFNMHYKIDLIKRVQINKTTKYKREIRQMRVTDQYPLDTLQASGQLNGTRHHGSTYPHYSPQAVNSWPSTQNSSGSVGISSAPNHNSAKATSGAMTFAWLPSANTPATNGSNHMHSGSPDPSGNSSPTTSGTSPTSTSSQSPSAITTVQSPSASQAKPKKRRSTPVVVRPCPPGGVPCDAAASTGPIPVSQVLQKFAKKVDVDPNSSDTCAICQSNLTEDSGFGSSKDTMELSLCQHMFHVECLEASYSHGVQDGSIICPNCTKMHGIKTGNQPDGMMMYSQMSHPLPGFSGCGTIRIEYHISPGIQTANHPHPGRSFSTPGFPRIGYLPDNDDGRGVLLLLIEAWKRRLIFTVGQSSTSGMQDCVTWTSIHHKTEIQDRRGHGYPDDTYLDRVTSELEARGVTDETL